MIALAYTSEEKEKAKRVARRAVIEVKIGATGISACIGESITV